MPATRPPVARPGLAHRVRRFARALGTNRSKLVDLVVDNLLHLFVVLAVVLLLAAGLVGQLVGVVVGLGGLGLVVWLLRREVIRQNPLLGRRLGARLLLLVALAGGFLLRRPDDAGWVWSATGLALFAVLSEVTLRALLAKTDPVAVHLRGVPEVPAAPFRPERVVWVSLALLPVGGVLAALAAPGWTYLAAAALAVAPTVVLAQYALRANTAARTAQLRVGKALRAHAPAFAVYYAAVQGARYQLGMWLPYLERLGQPFVVITRSPVTVPAIAGLTDAPVVVPQTGGAGTVESLVVPSLKAAFYVQGSSLNANFQRFRQLTHVWLNHGDSDKAANFSPRHATYDKVFVSGQQGVERYAAHGVHIPPEKFAVVGRPQVERIEVHDEPAPPGGRTTVLYAPTWRGGRPRTNYSSLPLAENIVAALLERGSTVVFRPHPLSYVEPDDAAVIGRVQRRLEADRLATRRPHLWGPAAETERDIPACINATEALITDVSSVASDYLASGKPIAMVAIQSSGDAFRQQFPMARVSYVIEKDLRTLDVALDGLLGPDPLAEERRAYRRYCLGDHLGPDAPKEFLRVAGEIVGGDRR